MIHKERKRAVKPLARRVLSALFLPRSMVFLDRTPRSDFRVPTSFFLLSMVFPLAALCAQGNAGAAQSNASSDRYVWTLEEEIKNRSNAPASAVAPGPVADKPPGGVETATGQILLHDDAGAVKAGSGISPEAYDRIVKENIKLRREIAEIRKHAEEISKINSDLVEKVKTLERTPPGVGSGAPAAPKAGRTAGAEGDGSALATTLEENLTLQEQNRTLQTEVGKLRAEVNRLQAITTPGNEGPALSEKSDLFRRIQQDNVLLARELQEQKEMNRRLTVEGNKSATESGDARKKVQQLKDENAQLRKAVLALDAQVKEAAGLKEKLTAARKELEEKDKLLSEAEQVLGKHAGARGELSRASREAEAFRKERSHLLFNLGVLHAKTGMYSDAAAAFQKVLDSQPEAADVHFNLGVIYDEHLSDRKKAEYHYKKFLELDPLNGDAGKVKLWLLELEMDVK